MLDKTSEEYKKVEKLYKSGKISKEDYERLLEALESYDLPEEEVEEAPEATKEERAERTVGKLIKEKGIKIISTVKSGLDKANTAAERMSDNIRDSLHTAVQNLANSLADPEYDDGEEVVYEEVVYDCGEESFTLPETAVTDAGRTPEHCALPYDKLYIKVDYIGEKNAEYFARTTKKEALRKKCKKIMGAEVYSKLCSVLDDNFVGKYEYSCGDEYVRVLIRPKK